MADSRDDNKFEEETGQPAAENSDTWEDVERRLEELRPDDPSPEALDRIWHSIDAEVDGAEMELEIGSRLQQLDAGEPTENALDRIWERVEEDIDASEADEPAPLIQFPAWRWAAAAAAVVILLLVGPLRVAAADALPGSLLYPVKRVYEQVRLGVAVTPAQRATVALTLADRRRSEAERLVARGGSSEQVERLTSQALSYLSDYAAGTEAASEQVQLWEQSIGAWPDAYRVEAGAALASWRNEHPDIAGGAAPTPTPTATRSASEPPVLRPRQTNTPIFDPTATATRTPTPTATRTVVPTQTPSPITETTPAVPGNVTPTLPQLDVTATLPSVLPTGTPTVPPVLPSTTPTVVSVLPSATATPAAFSTVPPTETSTPNASSTPAPAPLTPTLPSVLPSETPTLPPILPSETPTLPALLPSATPTLDALP